MSDSEIRLSIDIDRGEGDDDRELEKLATNLRRELLETDVKSVALARSGSAPKGAKVVDPIALGSLLVTLSASGGLLATTVGTIREWLSRRHGGSVKLKMGDEEISLTGLSSEQQNRLIEEWIKRHGGSK